MDGQSIRNTLNPSRSIFSCNVGGSPNILCLNCTGTRLIAAGRQNFQLFTIEQTENGEQFNETYDFRIPPRHPRVVAQPTDIGWSPTEDHVFASASAAGVLSIWDVNQITNLFQSRVHSATINRLQFDPSNPKLVLTASQDGTAKLIDFRTINTNRVVREFRYSSEAGFRDIHINPAAPHYFAAALNDRTIIPIWDFRSKNGPAMLVSEAQQTVCLAWNPIETNWLATGGRDRTIRVWNVQDTGGRSKPIFKIQSFGSVAKLGWRPSCRYHIASSTPTVDPRIHVWDVRRPYLPQVSFCHHQNSIGDFLWRSNTDNLISVGRDERLVQAHISTALRVDELVSLFSLNVTSKGEVMAVMPNIDDDYVRALYAEKHIPLQETSFKKVYSQTVMSTFLKWNQIISAKSYIGLLKDSNVDNSVEIFHHFARYWTFSTSDKSSAALAKVCDINSSIAEQLKRPDLKATWEVIKMIYADYDVLQNYRNRSSRQTTSANRVHHMSDSMGGPRHAHAHAHHHHHHHNHQGTHGKMENTDDQQQQQQQQHPDFQSGDDFLGRKMTKGQESIMSATGQIDMIDETDTYIVRDVLTDDIIFITPEDALNNSANNNGSEFLYENESDIDGMAIVNELLPNIIDANGDINSKVYDRAIRQYPGSLIVEKEMFETVEEVDLDDDMQNSTQSIPHDGTDKFFTIDESYCPTMQNHPLNFDNVIRSTLWEYVENNELQVAVHLLLALYPKLGEKKILELFNGAHHNWLIMYFELLQKIRLFVKAKQLIKHCVEKEIKSFNYETRDFDGAFILSANSPAIQKYPSVPTKSNSMNPNPPPTKYFTCAICRTPCRGMFIFCGICFHGGHIDHIRPWFHSHDECPFGCGHRCKIQINRTRRSRDLSQRVTLNSSTFFLQ